MVQRIIPEIQQLREKLEHTVQRLSGLEQRSQVPEDVVLKDMMML